MTMFAPLGFVNDELYAHGGLGELPIPITFQHHQ